MISINDSVTKQSSSTSVDTFAQSSIGPIKSKNSRRKAVRKEIAATLQGSPRISCPVQATSQENETKNTPYVQRELAIVLSAKDRPDQQLSNDSVSLSNISENQTATSNVFDGHSKSMQPEVSRRLTRKQRQKVLPPYRQFYNTELIRLTQLKDAYQKFTQHAKELTELIDQSNITGQRSLKPFKSRHEENEDTLMLPISTKPFSIKFTEDRARVTVAQGEHALKQYAHLAEAQEFLTQKVSALKAQDDYKASEEYKILKSELRRADSWVASMNLDVIFGSLNANMALYDSMVCETYVRMSKDYFLDNAGRAEGICLSSSKEGSVSAGEKSRTIEQGTDEALSSTLNEKVRYLELFLENTIRKQIRENKDYLKELRRYKDFFHSEFSTKNHQDWRIEARVFLKTIHADMESYLFYDELLESKVRLIKEWINLLKASTPSEVEMINLEAFAKDISQQLEFYAEKITRIAREELKDIKERYISLADQGMDKQDLASLFCQYLEDLKREFHGFIG